MAVTRRTLTRRVATARENLAAARTHEAANPGSEAHRACRQGRELDLAQAERYLADRDA